MDGRGRLIGIGVVVVSSLGLVLGIGTLVWIERGPPERIREFREHHASILAEHGLPADVVQRVRENASITDDIRTALPPDQRKWLDAFEESLPAHLATVHQEASTRRRQSWMVVGLTSALLLLGAYVVSRASRPSPPQ